MSFGAGAESTLSGAKQVAPITFGIKKLGWTWTGLDQDYIEF